MNWVEIIEAAIEYIERNITEDLTVGMIAEEVNTSAFYFQRGFSMLCGYTVGEYVRMRRLSLAGEELLSTDTKVIDLAIKYGYDSPDIFMKYNSLRHIIHTICQAMSFSISLFPKNKKNLFFGNLCYNACRKVVRYEVFIKK